MENENIIRLSVFLGLLCLFSLLEYLIPRRGMLGSKTKRVVANLSLVVVDSIAVKVILPMTAGLFAVWVAEQDKALLGFHMPVILAIILLDMVIYWQHRVSHVVPIFWLFHQVHHSDNAIDTSTALRFHPVEIVLSMLVKFAAIIIFGIPVMAIVIFEIVLNGTALFNHSNMRVPFDKVLRLFIVTPDMHRVHHSVIPSETNSNYGFNLPWWDHIFGSYVAQPKQSHEKMKIGLNQYDGGETSLVKLLLMPFKSK